jgi:hypothetical protein
MSVTIKIEGFDEARKTLEDLPKNFQKQTVLLIFRRSGQIFVNEAKARCNALGNSFSKLADSIGFIPVRTEENPVVVMGIRVKGKYKYVGYIGAWVEYGVSGVKKKLSSSVKKEGDETFRAWVGRIPKGGRYRKDQPAQPFMRPALDAKVEPVRKDVISRMEEELYKATQNSLKRYARAKGRAA